MTQKETVLRMLKSAGQSGVRSDAFFAAGMPRGCARVLELREEGHEIDAQREGKYTRFVLVGLGSQGEPQNAVDRNTFAAESGEGHHDRFMEKVRPGGPDDCWQWVGGQGRTGYGKFWIDGHYRVAHRVGYELLVGPIPEGLELDHLCRNRGCVNPAHLEPVTRVENVRRGRASRRPSDQPPETHCANGHLWVEDNVRVNAKGYRECWTCRRESRRREYAAKQGVVPGGVNETACSPAGEAPASLFEVEPRPSAPSAYDPYSEAA